MQICKAYPISISIMCVAILGCGNRPVNVTPTASIEERVDGSAQEPRPTPMPSSTDDTVNTLYPAMQVPAECELQSSVSELPQLPNDITPHAPALNTNSVPENWGIGYLGVTSYSPGLDWIGAAIFPLYEGPNGIFLGWMACGSFVDGQTGEVRSLDLPPMIQTSYEDYSFIVLEIDGDGWFQITSEVMADGELATAWVHHSHLGLTQVPLAMTLWAEHFQTTIDRSFEAGSLYFRNREIAHALRHSPSETEELITWIGEDHMIKPLEIQGDWMRVSVRQPSDYCVASADWNGTIHEGWVRWTSEEQGTWLYYYPRGC